MAGKSSLKVLMTADTIGGVWNYSISLIKGLQKWNIQVVLATMGETPTPEQLSELDDLNNLHLHSSNYKLEWMEEPWEDIKKASEWLLELNHSFNPDIIHLNNYAFGSLPWNKPLLIVGHSCVLSWWDAVKNEPAPNSWNTYKEIVQKNIQSSDLFITPTRSLMQKMLEFYSPIKNQKVVYNGSDQSHYREGPKENIIFTMGRLWDEAKNIKQVIKAAKFINYPIYIAGEENKEFENLHIPGNVNFLGKLDQKEISNWLSRAKVYLLPAKYEPFGLSVLEAALSGCALVIGDISTLKELWHGAAKFVDPENDKKIAHHVNYIMENESVCTEYANEAKKRASNYQLKEMAIQYKAIYDQMNMKYSSKTKVYC